LSIVLCPTDRLAEASRGLLPANALWPPALLPGSGLCFDGEPSPAALGAVARIASFARADARSEDASTSANSVLGV